MAELPNPLQILTASADAGRKYFDNHKDLPVEYLDLVCHHLDVALRAARPDLESLHTISPTNDGNTSVVHYTSIDALVSMLRQALKDDSNVNTNEMNTVAQQLLPIDQVSSLRLYDSVHSNDPDEGNYFTRILRRKYSWLGPHDATHAYMCSFIDTRRRNTRDNLVFWRTYGKDGAGCSLFVPVANTAFRRVHYGSSKVKTATNILAPVLDVLVPLVGIPEPGLSAEIATRLRRVVWSSLETFAYLYKRKAYKYEQELRIVISESDVGDKNTIGFDDTRDGLSCIRHYCGHPALAIRELMVTGSVITLGPCAPDRYSVVYYLRSLLKTLDRPGPHITSSKILYRRT